MKRKIKRGTRKEAVEEHVQLYNFEQWSRNHPDFNTIGYYGMIGRLIKFMKRPTLVTAQEKIANYSISNEITERNPYIPPQPSTPPTAKVPGQCGRPKGAKNKVFNAPAQPRKLRSTPATPPKATIPSTSPRATVPSKCGRPKGARNKIFKAPAQPRKLRSTPTTPQEATVPASPPRKRGRLI